MLISICNWFSKASENKVDWYMHGGVEMWWNKCIENIRVSVVSIKGGHFHSFKKDATFLMWNFSHIWDKCLDLSGWETV